MTEKEIDWGLGWKPQEVVFIHKGQGERSDICTFCIKTLLACFWTSFNLLVQTMVRDICRIMSKANVKAQEIEKYIYSYVDKGHFMMGVKL